MLVTPEKLMFSPTGSKSPDSPVFPPEMLPEIGAIVAVVTDTAAVEERRDETTDGGDTDDIAAVEERRVETTDGGDTDDTAAVEERRVETTDGGDTDDTAPVAAVEQPPVRQRDTSGAYITCGRKRSATLIKKWGAESGSKGTIKRLADTLSSQTGVQVKIIVKGLPDEKGPKTYVTNNWVNEEEPQQEPQPILSQQQQQHQQQQQQLQQQQQRLQQP